MAFFEFIGTPGDGRDGVTAFGYVFPMGEIVEVTDAFVVSKLSANGHFRKHDGRSKGARKAKGKPDDRDEG